MIAVIAAWMAIERLYEVAGTVEPVARASVTLHGATTPYAASTLSDPTGRFRFTRITAGQYTLSAFVPGYGEKRITIDVGPSTADAKGRFLTTIRFDRDVASETMGGKVAAADLAISDRARRQYSEAQKRLEKRDVAGAEAQLKKAIEYAPRFAAAWNHLGTIAYQTGRYADAEKYFRQALDADKESFEPLVNLGGVLLTAGKADEAYQYNLYSVLKRPGDALANSQLGMTYLALGDLSLAEKYLREAVRLDAAHFSHPQLWLAEIYLRRHEREKAVESLEQFLVVHPDWHLADAIRKRIATLRQGP